MQMRHGLFVRKGVLSQTHILAHRKLSLIPILSGFTNNAGSVDQTSFPPRFFNSVYS